MPSSNRLRPTVRGLLGCWLAIALCAPAGGGAQQLQRSGQTVVPVYEGFQRKPDGSLDLLFGYFNRNWEDRPNVPVGPDNHFSPGDADRGQPAHFYPRRNRFVFRVPVPAEFGNGELVWTLKTQGETLTAYGTLRPEYELDDVAIMANFGGAGGTGFHPSIVGNVPPALAVDGVRRRTVSAGEPITLAAVATDDGKPAQRPLRAFAGGIRVSGGGRVAPSSATGLRLSWILYRGPGEVVFDPPQIKTWEDMRDGGGSPWSNGFETPQPPDGNRWVTRVTFSAPGTYVLRCLAHDGGLQTYEDVTFVVSR
ncbi:MAG: hypothetical protein OXF27_01785 [Acidobacteria bacterium]|nr:hypothetical protein [Acidobacteriota bacterium]